MNHENAKLGWENQTCVAIIADYLTKSDLGAIGIFDEALSTDQI